jgi:hypothetical protein
MMLRMLPVAALSLALLVTPGTGATALFEGSVTPDQYTWTLNDDGAYRLELVAGRPLGVTGQPDLPGLDLLLLVAPEAVAVDVRIEPLKVRREPLPGPLALARPLLTSEGQALPQEHLAPADGAFPPTWGQFGGLHDWRGYRMLAVNVHPFRVVDTADGPVLEVLEEYTIEMVTDPTVVREQPLARQRQVAGERAQLEAALTGVVANPERIGSYGRVDGVKLDKAGDPFLPAPRPSLDGSAVRYLIVTSEVLAGEFQRLADHRTAQGLPALVVTLEWIAANYRAGADMQETLRYFLQDAYAMWGVEFVLIGGDTDVVPTRVIRSNFYPYGGHTDIPTDLYYAGLDGSWAADGDGWFGEPYVNLANPGDEADFAADVNVGRAPVSSPLAVSQFVDKVIGYELAPVGAGWANRALFAAEVLFPGSWSEGDSIQLDGALYASNLINGSLADCTGMESVRMYETDQLFPRDADLTRRALIDSLNTGHYGQVNQFGHGHYFNMSVGDANFTVSDAAALRNPNPFLLFAINCASGAFDVSCLLERFVQNPQGGAIMSVGAAREAFPSNSFGYQDLTYQNMWCGAEARTAVALNAARLAYIGNTLRNTIDRWTQLNAVVIGDPAVSIWSGSPLMPQIAAPSTVVAGEQTLVISIQAGGTPVAGADVGIRKGTETYAHGVTDQAGQASLTVIPATAGELVLTVSGKGLARTTQTIAVTPVATYLQLDDVTISDTGANGNGVAESGEVIGLAMSFNDVGGAGATNLEVTITTEHPDVTILSGTASLADCPAGGSTETLSALTLGSSALLADGTAVPLRVDVTDGTETWTSMYLLNILAPEARVTALTVDDAVHGDGDGVIDAGERLVLLPRVKNDGGGRLDQLLIQVTDVPAGVTVHGGSAQIIGLESLDEAGPSVGELSISLDDPLEPMPGRLEFVDNHGRTMALDLGFGAVAPPGDPVPDATVAPDAIALRWDPSGEDGVIGYHVYRATTAEGPFVRANGDLIANIAYFEDRGLDQLSFYWYKVTAVDRYFMESDFSGVVGQTTMPAEQENFPLSFAVPTSSHLAVGDVTGDGRLEIVLAADEVYVWTDDGTEVLDGDEDPQSTGPFTNLEGLFGPAGVALGELDGHDGLEIIASERSGQPQILVYRGDGTPLPGWPRQMQSSWNWAAPTVGDIDGDGDNEVVVNDVGGRLFVWHHDGVEFVDGDANPATDGVFIDRPDNWTLSSPAIADLDGDGAGEMIFGTRVSSGNGLQAYRHDGSQAAGFPYSTGTEAILCSPAVADLDGDGSLEIVFFTLGRKLHVVRSDGSVYPGFPVTYPGITDDTASPSPAVGNFDDDQDLEIVWPVNLGTFRMDLVVVDTDVAGGTSGDIMTGWPVQLPANSEGSPVVGDLDGDGMADIVQPIGSDETDTPDLIAAYNRHGEPLAGFPIALDGICRSTPTICDFDRDGDVDLVYGSWDLLLHVWDLPAPYDPTVIPWPTFQGSVERDGLAVQLSYTAVPEVELPAAFTVLPPRPNPFNPITTFRLYVTPGPDTRLDLAVFDVRGRMIRRLHQGERQPGWHEFTWDGRDDGGRAQASGVYFVRARQAQAAQTFKMTLVK